MPVDINEGLRLAVDHAIWALRQSPEKSQEWIETRVRAIEAFAACKPIKSTLGESHGR